MLSLSYLLNLASLVGIAVNRVQGYPFEPQRALTESDTYQSAQSIAIPGGTAFKFCPESNPATDLFTVERIVWNPYPPTMHVFSFSFVLFSFRFQA